MFEDFILFVAVGFAAQMVDGAIGMAYGLSGASVLLSFGVPPATASASIHAAEVFTTGISGYSHWRLRNIRWSIVGKLAIPGMIGGALGAYILTGLPADIVKPVVSSYLAIMGGWILWKALRRKTGDGEPPRWISLLGFGGGFVDAIGGGGWGPVVTSTLIGHGTHPRYTIGSVNFAEFFVTVTISVTFLGTIGLELWPMIAGLIVGGAVAAPLAAYATKAIPDRPLMVLVGVVIMLLSARNLIQVFG
ncbi:MAG: sulfite exporter TauE/SafE family protein [Sphingomonadales bacterium]|nr:sulfite exporter TauE/SafE family protein [Sphingomonadales bacterium]